MALLKSKSSREAEFNCFQFAIDGLNFFFYPLFMVLSFSTIMDLRHQSSAMYIVMLGGEDTHPWSATKVENPIPATIPVDQ